MEHVLILGAKGMLGGELKRLFPRAFAWDREEVDVTHTSDLRLKIQDLNPKPEAIINCVAYNDVDGAETKKELAFALNTKAPGDIAALCGELGIPMVHFSTNYVFDGERGEYGETDTPHPLSVYAQSKYEGELAVQKNTGHYYLIRTAVLFGPKGESELSKKSFIELMLDLSAQKDRAQAVCDEINSITYVVDLARQVRVLLDQAYPWGIYHVVNSGSGSWYDFAQEIFNISKPGFPLDPIYASEFQRPAARPKKSVLLNTKLPALRPWQEALREYLNNEV